MLRPGYAVESYLFNSAKIPKWGEPSAMMIKSGRNILLAVMLGVVCTVSGLAFAEESASYTTDKIVDGVYLFNSGGHRSLFLVGDSGVIVTDPIDAAAAKAYREAISRITQLPVKYVVYSHYHWDRIAGGQIFKDEGASFVAQQKCAERLKVYPNPEVVNPDITFTDRLNLNVGNMALELHYFGPVHGDCLTVFNVQPANLLQIVEMVNPPRASFPDDPNVPHIKPHNLREFFAAVVRLAEERGVEQVIASTVPPDEAGNMMATAAATGPITLIADQAAFWNAIYAAVETAKEDGNVDLDSFVLLDTIDLGPFKSYARYNPGDLPVIMRRFVGFYDMGR